MKLKLLTENIKHNGAGLFIRLPDELAKQYPNIKDDDSSPRHITLLYIGDITDTEKSEIIDVTSTICDKYAEIEAFIGGLAYFSNEDAEVAHSIVEAQGLAAIREEIWDALLGCGIKVGDRFPHYTPHVTLEYGEKRDYKGELPEGNFKIKEIELWSGNREDGSKVLHKFKLSGKI